MKEKENLKRMKRALVVVDMVNGFMKEGNMAMPDANYINNEVVRLVELFLDRKDDVIALMEGHTNNSTEFNDFPEHCILGTEEAELIDVLKVYQDRMRLIRKNSTSGFVTKEFYEYLEKNKDCLEEIVFVGVCIDICVLNASVPTKMYFNQNNIKCDVVVPTNACETYDASNHSREEYTEVAKKVLKLNGIKVVDRYE